jgi:hypothetical protein
MLFYLALGVSILFVILLLIDDWKKCDDPAGWDGVTREYLYNGRSVGYDAQGNKEQYDPDSNINKYWNWNNFD